jgi:hypothetical protein
MLTQIGNRSKQRLGRPRHISVAGSAGNISAG